MKILLYKVRTVKNMKLRQIEYMTGISRSTLNRIENAETSPTLNQMELLAKALKVRITNLFESEYK